MSTLAFLYLLEAVLTVFVFFFVGFWAISGQMARSLNTDLPNEILIKNARILSTAVYRYWHNQFLERAYAEWPPVRDAAYACGPEFSSDSSTAEKNRTSKISSGTASVDSDSIGSKKYSDSGSLLSLYSVRFAELGNRIFKVLNFVCCFFNSFYKLFAFNIVLNGKTDTQHRSSTNNKSTQEHHIFPAVFVLVNIRQQKEHESNCCSKDNPEKHIADSFESKHFLYLRRLVSRLSCQAKFYSSLRSPFFRCFKD